MLVRDKCPDVSLNRGFSEVLGTWSSSACTGATGCFVEIVFGH